MILPQKRFKVTYSTTRMRPKLLYVEAALVGLWVTQRVLLSRAIGSTTLVEVRVRVTKSFMVHGVCG